MNKCVYLLRDNNNVIRYIGQGSLGRIKKRNGRSKEYLEILDNSGVIEVIATGLSRSESLNIEHKLIQENLSTILNKKSSPKISKLVFEDLNNLFELSSESPSGIVWKVDRFNASNTRKAVKGSTAGSFGGITGWTVPVKGKYKAVHRVVWVLSTKTDLDNPDLVVNHIDGNPKNNKITNLELCSQRVNCLKTTKHPLNTTGCVGIKLELNKNRSPSYRVSISPKTGKRINKNFAISVHGLLPAFALAVRWRENKIKELITNDNYY